MNNKLVEELREWAEVQLGPAMREQFNEILSRHATPAGEEGYEKCYYCDGSGRVPEGEYQTRICPKCDGSGEVVRHPTKPTEPLAESTCPYWVKGTKGVRGSMCVNQNPPTIPLTPLAVLADRKGQKVLAMYRAEKVWVIRTSHPAYCSGFDHSGLTYTLAEAEARAYLEGLDDKADKG